MVKYAVLILWRKKGVPANFYAFCISVHTPTYIYAPRFLFAVHFDQYIFLDSTTAVIHLASTQLDPRSVRASIQHCLILPHHSDQMSERSQVSTDALSGSRVLPTNQPNHRFYRCLKHLKTVLGTLSQTVLLSRAL